MKIRLPLLVLSLTVAVFFQATSCTGKSVAQKDPSASDPGLAQAIPFGGKVTFLCGKVEILENGQRSVLDIGMSVGEKATVFTDDDATCEIQFGEFGSVHLSPLTTLDVSRLLGDDKRAVAELSLKAGSVVCKVRKLAGDDSFSVRTQEMVCGVRGTVFMVSTEGKDRTKLAVSEGSVTVYPSSTVATIEADASGTPSPLLSAAKTEIAAIAPVLAEGEELTVTRVGMAESDRIIGDLYTVLAGLSPESPDADVQAGLSAGLKQKIAGYGNESRKTGTAKQPIAGDTKVLFDDASNLSIRKIEASLKISSDAEAQPLAENALTKLTVKTDPADSSVSVNGVVLSQGAFTGLFNKDETVILKVVKEGFVNYQESITIADASPIERSIRLEPGSSPAENQGPSVSSVGTSKLMFVSNGPGDSVAISDAAGNVHLCDGKGKLLWSGLTGNGGNSNSPAVGGESAIVYAGDKNLCVFNPDSGKKSWSLPLGKTNSGLFGRHPVLSGNVLVTSSDQGLASYDLATGNPLAAFAIPEGTDMSPALLNGTLYVASKSGAFYSVDAATMASVSTLQTRAFQPVASAPALIPGHAVIVDRRGLVTMIALDSMGIEWEKKLDPARAVEVFSDPLFSGDGVFVSAKGILYALAAKDGNPRFAPVQGVTTQPCFARNYLWCGGTGGVLMQISPTNGKIERKIQLPAAASGRPFAKGETLYIPLENGKLALLSIDMTK